MPDNMTGGSAYLKRSSARRQEPPRHLSVLRNRIALIIPGLGIPQPLSERSGHGTLLARSAGSVEDEPQRSFGSQFYRAAQRLLSPNDMPRFKQTTSWDDQSDGDIKHSAT
jgi:hypothetical protein